MWILILFIGLSASSNAEFPTSGGPATATFATEAACKSALSLVREGFGNFGHAIFDETLQLPPDGEDRAKSRSWLIKGVCVPQK